jgi:hypothetical protein
MTFLLRVYHTYLSLHKWQATPLACFQSLFSAIVVAVLSLSMVDNSEFSPKRLTILIDPAYSSFIRKLSMPHISSSEDLYGPSCVLAHTLSGAALASLLAPSSAFPLKSRGHAYHSQ